MKPSGLRSISSLVLALALGSLTPLRAATTGDSLRYLTAADTVMLEIADDQRKYTTHTFAPRQTLYSLSRFYAQTLEDLLSLNPGLAAAPPDVGQEVRVGVPNRAITRYRRAGFRYGDYAPVCYRVREGETAYKIAKTIFRMPVDTLLAVNGLESFDLSPGQVLQVGWLSVDGATSTRVPLAPAERELSPLQRKNFANYRVYAAQAERPTQRRTVATWSVGAADASGRLYALASGRPRGSMLKVTNAANGRVAFVRVIGAAAGTVDGPGRAEIQVSPAAAKLLGATDRNFYVIVE